MSTFDLELHRAERASRLERENEYLRAEHCRLASLLADALRVAVAGTSVSPLALLNEIAVINGTNLGRAAFLERQERQQAEELVERTIRVLRETS